MELCIIFPYILSIPAFIFFCYLSFKNQEERKQDWSRLAQANNLTFTPGVFLSAHGYVHGRYRGHLLKLETFRKNDQNHPICTHISLSAGRFPNNEEAAAESLLASSTSSLKIDLIKLLTAVNRPSFMAKGKIKISDNGSHISYTETGFLTDAWHLQRLFDAMCDMIDSYAQVIALGGEAIGPLKEIVDNNLSDLRFVALQLMEGIARRTDRRFGNRTHALFCPDCLVSYAPHKVRSMWRWSALTYYGCRNCRQSRRFLEGRLIAVLDTGMETAYTTRNEIVRVNWLVRRMVFDFDEVHIVQAIDEDVERFAVQVGNDTDEKRRAAYRRMPCTISADCRLSPNTGRILEKMFGQVVILDTVKQFESIADESEASQAKDLERSKEASSQFPLRDEN